MSTMNVTLPDDLQSYVDQQVAEHGFLTCSEYIRELIRKERDRQQLRALVLEGMASPPAAVADAEYFDQLRSLVSSSSVSLRRRGPARSSR